MKFYIASLVSESIFTSFRQLFCIAVYIAKLTTIECSTTYGRYTTGDNNIS